MARVARESSGEVPDLDAALEWAGRVTAAIGVPIEVRPLAGFEA